jgi:GPI mannosyltransferase 2
MLSAKHVLNRPIRSLLLIFALWKGFLLTIAFLSTLGAAYDTSAGLLLDEAGNTRPLEVVVRLTSWDAIYYVEAARRDRIFEQEWAFGSGLPLSVRVIVQGERFIRLICIWHFVD